MIRKRFANIIIIAVSMLILISCAHPPQPEPTIQEIREGYIHALRSEEVQVIQTGETMLVSIPSDELFYPHSSNISPHGEAILPPLLDLLATYQTGIMKISGHTDNLCNNEIFNRALSERQARRVADCLVNHGMDARLIYTLGCGSSEPISSNFDSVGRMHNRRVDIQFRFLSGDNE